MPFSTAQRLQSLGVATPLARELGAQIDSGTYNYSRLMWSGMPVQLAQIVATTPFNAIKAVELGMIPDVAKIRAGAAGQDVIGGIAVGSAGAVGTIYEGYTLAAGDDFNTLDILAPHRPRGKYWPTRTYLAGPRGSTSESGVGLLSIYDTDPFHTGYNDLNRGVPVGYDNMSVDTSVLKLRARRARPEEKPFFYNLPNPRNEVGGMISGAGALGFFADAAGSGDIILEARLRYPAGTPAGAHPTFWFQSWAPIQAYNSDEFDHEGTSVGFTFHQNVWVNGTNTGGPSSGTQVVHDGQWQNVAFVINKANVRRFINGTLNGTLNNGNSYDKPQYPLFTNHIFVGTFDGDTYNEAAWNAAGDVGGLLEFDWFRVWSRTGKPHYKPLQVVADRNVDYGSSLTFTLPTAVSLWGDATVTEYLQCLYNEANEPGNGYDTGVYLQFPAGVSYNSGTREVTVNIASGKTGRLNFAMGAWKAGTTFEPLRFAVNVGPNPVVPQLGAAGQVVNIDLYALQDVGVLNSNGVSKAKTISVSGLAGSGLSYNDATGFLTGTAVGGTYNVTVTVTNSVGQSKSASASRTIASYSPATDARVLEWWNADDNTTVFSDAAATTPAVAGSSSVQAFVGKKIAANASNSVGAQTPEYLTDANGKKIVKFVAANNDYLFTQAAGIISAVSGDDKPYAIVGAFKRGTPGVGGTALSFSPDTGTVNNYIRHSFGSTNNIGIGRQVAGTLTQNASPDGAAAADQWYTVSWVFEGTTVTIRLNGSVVLNAGALNSAPITVNRLSIGGRYDDQANAYTSAAGVPFGGAVGEFMVMTGVTAASGEIGVAEAYLMARWTN